MEKCPLLRVVFFGSSGFALPGLNMLLASGENVLAVVTAPDRKKGRGLKITGSPVKDAAVSSNLPILQPDEISEKGFIAKINELAPDILVVVAYGHILTKEILDIPRLYPINLHASLLPKYRGPAPINWALINGERATGVTIIRMDEFIDTGDIILQKEVPIAQEDDALTLSDKLSGEGARILADALGLIKKGIITFRKQEEAGSSLAPLLKKSTGKIDWQMSAQELHNRVRGLLPWPCAFTNLGQKMFKVLRSRIVEDGYGDANPGTIVALSEEDGIVVQTGRGKIGLEEVQLEGGKRMSASDFIRGHKLKVGLTLGVVI